MDLEIRSIATHDGVALGEIEIHGDFYFALRLEIGIKGDDGADIFDLFICSVSWLAKQNKPMSGQYLIIVDRFDPIGLENFLRGKVTGISGNTSNDLFTKFSRFAHWEYGDMASRPRRYDDPA